MNDIYVNVFNYFEGISIGFIRGLFSLVGRQ